jgi:hypothetical protein
MKKYLIFLLVIFIYTAYAQENSTHYQNLVKIWHEGSNGHGQGGPVDSLVLERIRSSILYDDCCINNVKKSPKMLKILEDLQRYRGLGIFKSGNYLNPTTEKVLREYYNVDIKDLKNIDTWNFGVERPFGVAKYLVVGVGQLPDGEWVYYLVSQITLEVLSTYKGKEDKP